MSEGAKLPQEFHNSKQLGSLSFVIQIGMLFIFLLNKLSGQFRCSVGIKLSFNM